MNCPRDRDLKCWQAKLIEQKGNLRLNNDLEHKRKRLELHINVDFEWNSSFLVLGGIGIDIRRIYTKPKESNRFFLGGFVCIWKYLLELKVLDE